MRSGNSAIRVADLKDGMWDHELGRLRAESSGIELSGSQ